MTYKGNDNKVGVINPEPLLTSDLLLPTSVLLPTSFTP